MIEKQMLEVLKDIFPKLCDRCRQPYDLAQHIPMMLCISQHMCCEKCFKDLCKKPIITCPFCSNQIRKEEVFKVRKFQAILEFIEKQNKNIENKIEQEYNNFKNELKQTTGYNPSQKWLETLEQQQKHIKQLRYSLVDQAKDFFKEKPARTAQILQEILFKYQDIEGAVFKGMGSKHEEEGFYHHKIADRIQLKNVKEEISLFDFLSLCYMYTSNYSSQKAWYDRMTKKYPDDYRVWYGLAVTEDNNKNYEAAEKLYLKVNEMNNTFDKPFELLSFIMMKIHKDKTEALKFASKALALNSQNIFAHYLIVKNIVGPSTQKIQSLSFVIVLESKYLAAPLELGQLYFQMKDYKNAAFCFEKCIDIPQETPNHPINRLRQCLVELGLLSKSEKLMLSSESFWTSEKTRLRSLLEQLRLPKGGNKVTIQPNKSDKATREQQIDPQKREKMRHENSMDSIYRLDNFSLDIQQQEEQQREKMERKKKEENKRPHSNYLYENRQTGMKTPEKKQERRPMSRSAHNPSLPNKAESVKKLKPQPARKEEKHKLYWI